MLCGKQPAYVAFGPELTSLYNDGYIPILGTKHPKALGQPYSEVWPEIWDRSIPLIDAVMAGEAQHFVDHLVPIAGRPRCPKGWFTFSWTPLRDETGTVSGFYCSATETTGQVLAQGALRESESGCASSPSRPKLASGIGKSNPIGLSCRRSAGSSWRS